MSRIVYLAHEIEWAHAIDRCRINGRFKNCRGRNAKELRRRHIAAEFDPHAATELAELIERTLFPKEKTDVPRR
jgi:hypothetical protein